MLKPKLDLTETPIQELTESLIYWVQIRLQSIELRYADSPARMKAEAEVMLEKWATQPPAELMEIRRRYPDLPFNITITYKDPATWTHQSSAS